MECIRSLTVRRRSMRVAKHWALRMALLSVAASSAVAAIVGKYSGLDALIAASNEIVVGSIHSRSLERPSSTENAWQHYKVFVAASIKGNLASRTTIDARLSILLFDPFATEGAVPDFLLGNHYVLFLHRNSDGSFEQVNVPGSAFWIHSTRDPSKLTTTNPRETLTDLVRSTAKYLRERSKHLEQRIESYLLEET